MSLLKNKLSLLKSAQYLEAQIGASNLSDIELLENGKRLRQQIEKQCSKTQGSIGGKDIKSHFATEQNESSKNFKDIHPRLHFIYTNEFRYNMKLLREATKKVNKSHTIKTLLNGLPYYEVENMPLQFKRNNGENFKLFITDQFFHTASGLAMLYNIQRERKIWWMRFSADPSRYYLDPFELKNKQNTTRSITDAQSITIKARLPFGDVGVEHITLVPLNEASLPNEHEFEIYNERTKKNQLPAVIRSVISLDVAACALIFDGAANKKRETTLFLNRKLTPYQCLVICRERDENSTELKDLCTHISNVLEHAGLRLLNMNEYIENKLESSTQLDVADKLGVPYTILIDANSLQSGLLQLRNRDTTLNETIHISDIPGYLLSIFQAN